MKGKLAIFLVKFGVELWGGISNYYIVAEMAVRLLSVRKWRGLPHDRHRGCNPSHSSLQIFRFIIDHQNADPGPPNRDARDAPNENCGPFWFGASKYLCVS